MNHYSEKDINKTLDLSIFNRIENMNNDYLYSPSTSEDDKT